MATIKMPDKWSVEKDVAIEMLNFVDRVIKWLNYSENYLILSHTANVY